MLDQGFDRLAQAVRCIGPRGRSPLARPGGAHQRVRPPGCCWGVCDRVRRDRPRDSISTNGDTVTLSRTHTIIYCAIGTEADGR